MNDNQLRILIDQLLDQDARNINRERKRRALVETCQFVDEYMTLVDNSFGDRFSLLEHALKQVTVQNGLWMEFGVYTGGTIRFIAERTENVVFGFDSFDGNPADWRGEFRKGAFALKEIPTGLPQNVCIVRGMFQDALAVFCKSHPEQAAFIHIDCDLYESTKTVFDALRERIVPGTVLVFDEFFNYPGWKKHEFKAFMEFVEAGNRQYKYLGYVYKHSQVAVQMLG